MRSTRRYFAPRLFHMGPLRQAPRAVVLVLVMATSTLAPTASARAAQLFSPTSLWNAPLSAQAPLDPASARISSALAAEARREFQVRIGPWISTTSGSTPIYVVPATQPTVPVALDNPTAWWRVSLARAFAAVPIPPGARPAPGPDAHMTIWQPSTNHLWEFFHAYQGSDGWHAAWGGAQAYVDQDAGFYNPFCMVGAQFNWGATASSLPVAGGVMRISELKAGRINHALALNVPYARASVWAWPAQRTDGTNTDPNSLPEGAHLRLDPTLDLSKLSLPPIIREMAQAAQTYGVIVRDQTHWALGFFAEDPAGAPDPYTGSTGLFGGIPPNYLLAKFPWESLQLLKMDLRSH